MAEPKCAEKNGESEEENTKKKKKIYTDPELFCCVFQPATTDSDAEYIGIRRILLHRKAEAGVLRRIVCSHIRLFRACD